MKAPGLPLGTYGVGLATTSESQHARLLPFSKGTQQDFPMWSDLSNGWVMLFIRVVVTQF